jgi:hypothetical protein
MLIQKTTKIGRRSKTMWDNLQHQKHTKKSLSGFNSKGLKV